MRKGGTLLTWALAFNKIVLAFSQYGIFTFNAHLLDEFINEIVASGWTLGELDKQLRKLLSLVRRGKVDEITQQNKFLGLDIAMTRLINALESNDFLLKLEWTARICLNEGYPLAEIGDLYHYVVSATARGLGNAEVEAEVQKLCSLIQEGKLGEITTGKNAHGLDKSTIILATALDEAGADRIGKLTFEQVYRAVADDGVNRGFNITKMDELLVFIDAVVDSGWTYEKLLSELAWFYQILSEYKLDEFVTSAASVGIDPVMLRLVNTYQATVISAY